jgi:hypothetical protein
VVVAGVVDLIVVGVVVVADADFVVAGPRLFNASVATAAGFGRAVSACGFAREVVLIVVVVVAAGLVAAASAAAAAITIKNVRIITKEILPRVATALSDGTTCAGTR